MAIAAKFPLARKRMVSVARIKGNIIRKFPDNVFNLFQILAALLHPLDIPGKLFCLEKPFHFFQPANISSRLSKRSMSIPFRLFSMVCRVSSFGIST